MICPDLRQYFRHYHWQLMAHALGVPVGCDWSDKSPADPVFGLYTQSGSWTMDEVPLLFAVADQVQGIWVDIGGATGWTAAHLAKAGCSVHAIEPMYELPEFRARAEANLSAAGVLERIVLWPVHSFEFFLRTPGITIMGAVIDGNHDAPHPRRDARSVTEHLVPGRGVLLFHDVRHPAVHEAVRFTIDRGFRCRPYPTCHGIAICWQGELRLPDYTPPLPGLQDVVWPEIKDLAT